MPFGDQRKDVCAVVVLYSPNMENIENLRNTIKLFDKIIVFSNSENNINDKYFFNFGEENFEYYCFSENLGIAYALNFAAKKALSYGYKYIITLDQDTMLPVDFIKRLFDGIVDFEKIGIISPFHNTANKSLNLNGLQKVLTTLTSGNAVNLQIFSKIGGFCEKLFIDYVDNEYCLRLNSLGYKVIRNNNVIIEHPLGNIVKKKIFHINLYPTNHPPIRLYYRTRNRLYCLKNYGLKYPNLFFNEIKNISTELLKIILFEELKKEKLKMILFGIIDFLRSKYGKYDLG